ncbi:MAG: pyridoxal 5'-phosphate synthase glutaminase subunit PdxT [Solirubrobacteraceae bacterium]
MTGRAPVGVLALQGDFEAHSLVLRSLGAVVREVRVPADLDGIGALVLPGGESTTMMLGAAREGLEPALREVAAYGLPILATCAGMILLDRDHLGMLDIRTERNAFGRQVRSFETDVSLHGFDDPIHALFIRAPWIVEHGGDVEVLGEVDGHVVAVRSGRILAVAFHPELVSDAQLHRWLLEQAADAVADQARV